MDLSEVTLLRTERVNRSKTALAVMIVSHVLQTIKSRSYSMIHHGFSCAKY